MDVTCFDHGEPGQGQSAGSSRVFRHHVGTPELAALAVESRAAWEDWSQRAGEPLLRQDGWVRLGGDRAADLALLGGARVPAIELDPDEAVARMPVIARPDGPVLLDPLGGATRTDSDDRRARALDRSVAAARAGARGRGRRRRRAAADRRRRAPLRALPRLRRHGHGRPRHERRRADRAGAPRARTAHVPKAPRDRRPHAVLERPQRRVRRGGLRPRAGPGDLRRRHRRARRLPRGTAGAARPSRPARTSASRSGGSSPT